MKRARKEVELAPIDSCLVEKGTAPPRRGALSRPALSSRRASKRAHYPVLCISNLAKLSHPGLHGTIPADPCDVADRAFSRDPTIGKRL